MYVSSSLILISVYVVSPHTQPDIEVDQPYVFPFVVIAPLVRRLLSFSRIELEVVNIESAPDSSNECVALLA